MVITIHLISPGRVRQLLRLGDREELLLDPGEPAEFPVSSRPPYSLPRRSETPVTGMEEPAKHHHFWVQAPMPPLDVDRLEVVTVGTVIFRRIVGIGRDGDRLRLARGTPATARGSRMQVAEGVLGLIGLAYCWNRRRRRRSRS